MNIFSEELKNEREAKNITLAEIARKTRINIKYLEALEQGAFDILPQTYVRAFIRAYAEAIGLSPAEILKKYEIHGPQQFGQSSFAQALPLQPEPSFQETEKILSTQHKKRSFIVTVAATIILTSIAIFIFQYINTTEKPETVTEVPFQEVIKENERQQQTASAVDSTDSTKIKVQTPALLPDSLHLKVVSLDSVWISIVRDSMPPRRGYLLTGRYRTYMAQKEFKVSFSDGGAVRLILNGTELPPLSVRGRSVRNYILNREILKKQ